MGGDFLCSRQLEPRAEGDSNGANGCQTIKNPGNDKIPGVEVVNQMNQRLLNFKGLVLTLPNIR